MPNGVGSNRDDQYEGREGAPARVSSKQRAGWDQTEDALRKGGLAESPDINLPIENYQRLTISQIDRRLESLSARELRVLRHYEAQNKNRKVILGKLDYRLARH
jgi:hypothetical protein